MTAEGPTGTSDRVVAARFEALLSGVRLVAIDVETCSPPDAPPRVVALGVVTTRLGRRPGQYSTLVDPQAPIDDRSHRVHGIDDDAVAGWPSFDTIAPVLEQLLDGHGEQVVLVAHNAGFDVSVLKAEFARVGGALPAVAVLDTARGATLDMLGVRRASRRLPDVGAAVGVAVVDHHDALADARACSQIAQMLLRLAAERGHDDLAALLEEVTGGRTTDDHGPAAARTGSRGAKRSRSRRHVSDAHVTTHAQVLDGSPTGDELQAWCDLLVTCAQLRCPMTADRVAGAAAQPEVLHAAVEQALRALLDADDVQAPAVASLLGGLEQVRSGLVPLEGRLGLRRAAFAWAAEWAGQLDALTRCSTDACPDCRAGRPCPLDTWREPLADLAFAESRERPRGLLRPNGANRGTGSYTTWLREHLDRRLADETLAVCLAHYRDTDDDRRARTVAQFGWDAGCRHPDAAALVADTRAAAGTEADLQVAVDVCDIVLATDGDSTAPSVQRLHATHARLSGLLARSRGRDTGIVDDDGNVIYAPRHHPTDPKRPPRRRRFSA